MSMEQLWNSLVLWHVLLPLAGALLVPLVRRGGPQSVRRVVIANVIGSVMLAALIVGAYLSRDAQLASEAPTRPLSSAVTLNFGADGVNLWFLAAIPLVVLCALVADSGESWSERPLPVVAILVAESAALALFAAGDVVVMCGAFGVLALANSLVVGIRGQPGVRGAARALLLQQLGASALITIGLAGTVVACAHMQGAPHAAPQPPVFDLDQLIQEIRRLKSVSPPAELVWRQLAPWLFLSLVVGGGVWSGAFPFHVTCSTALRHSGPVGRVLLGAIVLKAGVYGLIRILVPLFPELIATLGTALLLWILLSALYCAVSMRGAAADVKSPGQRVFPAEGAIVIPMLSMCGVLSQTVAGIVGAILLAVAHAVCWTLFVLAAGDGHGSPSTPPQRQGIQVFLMPALAGIPGLALFPGLLLVYLGISAAPATVGSWLVMLVLFWLVIAISGWTYFRQIGNAANGQESTISRGLMTAFLVAVIILIGVAPGIFTGPIEDTVQLLLGHQPLQGAG